MAHSVLTGCLACVKTLPQKCHAGGLSHSAGTSLSDCFSASFQHSFCPMRRWICQPTCCASEICDATEVELLNQHVLHTAEAPLWCEAKKQRGSSSGHISELKACCQLSLMSFLSGWICWDPRTLLIAGGIGENETAKVLRLFLACASQFKAPLNVENKLC